MDNKIIKVKNCIGEETYSHLDWYFKKNKKREYNVITSYGDIKKYVEISNSYPLKTRFVNNAYFVLIF